MKCKENYSKKMKIYIFHFLFLRFTYFPKRKIKEKKQFRFLILLPLTRSRNCNNIYSGSLELFSVALRESLERGFPITIYHCQCISSQLP